LADRGRPAGPSPLSARRLVLAASSSMRGSAAADTAALNRWRRDPDPFSTSAGYTSICIFPPDLNLADSGYAIFARIAGVWGVEAVADGDGAAGAGCRAPESRGARREPNSARGRGPAGAARRCRGWRRRARPCGPAVTGERVGRTAPAPTGSVAPALAYARLVLRRPPSSARGRSSSIRSSSVL
jgi:hypothetical protein